MVDYDVPSKSFGQSYSFNIMERTSRRTLFVKDVQSSVLFMKNSRERARHWKDHKLEGLTLLIISSQHEMWGDFIPASLTHPPLPDGMWTKSALFQTCHIWRGGKCLSNEPDVLPSPYLNYFQLSKDSEAHASGASIVGWISFAPPVPSVRRTDCILYCTLRTQTSIGSELVVR